MFRKRRETYIKEFLSLSNIGFYVTFRAISNVEKIANNRPKIWTRK